MYQLIPHPDPFQAPEYVSDNGVECSRCQIMIDADSETIHELTVKVNGGRKLNRPRTLKICSDCVELCDFCREHLDDETNDAMSLGPWVLVEGADGVRKSFHAECAADRYVQTLTSNRSLYVCDLSREQLAVVVGGAL